MTPRSKVVAILFLLPLMSLDSGNGYVIQRMKLENQQLEKEIHVLDYKIRVVDQQIRYKDSVDALNNQKSILNLSQ